MAGTGPPGTARHRAYAPSSASRPSRASIPSTTACGATSLDSVGASWRSPPEGFQLIAGDVPRRLGPNRQVVELHKDHVRIDPHDHPDDIARDPGRSCPAEAIARLEVRLKLGDTRRPLGRVALLGGLLPEGRLAPLALGRLFTLS